MASPRRHEADLRTADTPAMTNRSFTFHIPEELYEKLLKKAQWNERTLSAELRMAIKAWFNQPPANAIQLDTVIDVEEDAA